MKYSLSVLLIILVSALSAQDFKDDICLSRVKTNLPEGWNMAVKNDTLKFWHTDTVWVKFENKVNAPVDIRSLKDRNDDIVKHGKKTVCSFRYRLTPRWSEADMKKARTFNDSIGKVIQNLAEEKYKVAHIVSQPTKDEFFYGLTADEEKRVSAFLEERRPLEKLLKILPVIHTEKYSLFYAGETGVDDEMHSVYPQTRSNQFYQIRNMIGQNCDKVN